MAAFVDLTTFRGDSDSWDVTVIDSGSGLAIDLTSMVGRSFWFTVKQKITDADSLILFQKTIGVTGGPGGITVYNAVGGVIRISINPADTENYLAPMTFQYDLRFKNSDNKITTIALGRFQVLGNVTRVVS